MEFIHAVFEYGFLQKALLTSIMVGIISGVIGSFIVLRGMALMGDAISHAVLPGVAISYMLGVNFFYGAVITGILAALGIGFVNSNSNIKNDSSIGIVFTAFFALGIVLITSLTSSTDLYHILFGNVLAVRSSDMWLTLIIGIIILACVYLFYKELLISSFDPTMSATYGLPNQFIHYFLMTLLTLVTVASLQTVGVILVVAMLITPASTAYLLTNRLSTMIFLAMGFGVIAAIVGLYLSFIHNLSSGGSIVLVSAALFVIVFIVSPKHGVLFKKLASNRKRNEVRMNNG